MRFAGALLALLTLVAPRGAHAASISLFSTTDCSSCNLQLPLGGIGRFFVCAFASELLPSRPVGAEFRVTGLPPDWFVRAVIPNPAAAVVIGNPVGAGTNIAFATSQPDACLNLFTIEVMATTSASDLVLRVEPHSTPSNPSFLCPVLVMDWIAYSLICVDGGQMYINSPRDCVVAVQPGTWSQVKQVYRD